MRIERMISAVDTHVCGEPGGVIVGGIPRRRYLGRLSGLMCKKEGEPNLRDYPFVVFRKRSLM
jgi:proline racemase